MLKDQIDIDLKAALLSGDKLKVNTLRGLKSAILYREVEVGKRDIGLDDEAIGHVIAKESKKRQESIVLYKQGGDSQRAEAELKEKEILDSYLPEKLSAKEVSMVVDEFIKQSSSTLTIKDMGRVISGVKGKLGPGADGAEIARLVKERLAR